MKIKIYLTVQFIINGFFLSILFAQGGPPATPIDGGLSFLLAAGGVYGVKKLMGNNPKKDR